MYAGGDGGQMIIVQNELDGNEAEASEAGVDYGISNGGGGGVAIAGRRSVAPRKHNCLLAASTCRMKGLHMAMRFASQGCP